MSRKPTGRQFLGRGLAVKLGAVLAVLIFFGTSSLFIVSQGEQALVLQFGEPRQVIREPGLHFKLPFLQTVTYYERRLLQLDPPDQPVTLSDQKRLVADAYVQYRITDPLVFFQAVNNVTGANNRLASVINSSVLRVLGLHPLGDLLSAQRDAIMATIQAEVTAVTKRFGIEVVDVRLRRADLPESVSQAVFNRMSSERDREAKQFRAEGLQAGTEIRARADRDQVVLLAEAQRDAQILRGEGDAIAATIYAEAYSKDVSFYAFYRSLSAYREALNARNTTFLLSPDSQFFRYFGSVKGAPLPKP